MSLYFVFAKANYLRERLTFFINWLNMELNLASLTSPSGTKFSRFLLLVFSLPLPFLSATTCQLSA